MKLRNVIAQWILVRTFGYATSLLHRLDDDHAQYWKPSRREHIELLRGVCAALYRQVRLFGFPMMSITGDSPTEERFNNQWP